MLEPMKIIFTYTTMLPGCQEKDFGILWGFWIFCKKIWLKSASPQKLQQTVHLTRNLGINTVTPLLKRSQMASWSKNCKITLFWWRYTKKFIWHTGIVKTKRLKNYYFIDDSTRDHSVDITYCIVLIIILKAEVVIYCSDDLFIEFTILCYYIAARPTLVLSFFDENNVFA